MARSLRQQRLQTFVGSRAMTLTLLLIAGAVSLALGREIARRVSVSQELERLTGEIATAQQSTKDLENLIATLKSPTFQEGAARTQLNLQKSGETVLVVPTNGNNSSSTLNEANAGTPTEASAEVSNPRRWWDYFFGSHSS